MRRVVITGMGIVSSIGNNKDEVLDSLQNGKSGIVAMPEFAEMGFRSQVAGTVKNLDLNKFIDFGVHPVSHHYLSPENQFNPNSNIPLTLCQCSICGTIQLEETADVSYYNVRFSWVRQNEPG